MHVSLARFANTVEESALQLREEQRILVRRIVGKIGIVIGHQGFEAGHQPLDVDVAGKVTASLPLQQAAGIGQTANPISKGIIAEVVDEERGIRNQGAGETGPGYENALA